MCRELNKSERAVLRAITDAPVAWQTPEELASRLGFDPDQTNDLLADLDVEGWISAWEPEGRMVVTLTTLGADRLKVHLVEYGGLGTLRWAGIGEPEPPQPRSRIARGGDSDLTFFDTIADPTPPPDIQAELAEIMPEVEVSADGRPQFDLRDLPKPTILLGLGMAPWPSHNGGESHGACPICGTRALHPKAYCLWCDRWGLDPLMARRAARTTTGAPAVGCRRKRDHSSKQIHREREARKGRRKRKHEERWGTKTRYRPGLSAPRLAD